MKMTSEDLHLLTTTHHYLDIPWEPQIQQNPNWIHNHTLPTHRLVFPKKDITIPSTLFHQETQEIFLFLLPSFPLPPPAHHIQPNCITVMLVSNAFYMCHIFSTATVTLLVWALTACLDYYKWLDDSRLIRWLFGSFSSPPSSKPIFLFLKTQI